MAGSPFAAGVSPESISVDPRGKFLYIANGGSIHLGSGSTAISGYAIDSTSGALTPIPGSPFPGGTYDGSSIAIEPGGQFAYVAGDTRPYAIDAMTGALAQMPEGSQSDAGTTFLVFNPRGNFVYGACPAGICGFNLDAASGTLTQMAIGPTGDLGTPSSLAFDPSGKFLYGLNSNGIFAFAIDATSGAITAVAGGNYPLGISRQSLALHPSGAYAYVTNASPSNSISGFGIDPATGGLTEMANGPIAVGSVTAAIVAAPDGKVVYVSLSPPQPLTAQGFPPQGAVLAFAVDPATGALNQTALGPFPAGRAPNVLGIDPAGRFAYAANLYDGSASAYNIDALTGALTEMSASPFALGSSTDPTPTYPSSVAIDPSGRFAYFTIPDLPVTDSVDVPRFDPGLGVAAFTIDGASGALTAVPGSPFVAGVEPASVAVDPSGSFAFVANYTGGVSAFRIDSSTGFLSLVAGSPFGDGERLDSIVTDPRGTFAYATGWDGVTTLAIDSAGTLTVVASVPFACSSSVNNIYSFAVDAHGKFVYQLCPSGVWSYAIDATAGTLTEVPGSPFARGTISPTAIAVSQ